MAIEFWKEKIALVTLGPEPDLGKELLSLYQTAQEGGADIVLDFLEVDFITAKSLSKLLSIKKHLGDNSRRLILCNVSPSVKGVFIVTGLDGIFEIINDRFAALSALNC